MRRDGCLPLTVESSAGRADLLVDGARPLAELLAPLAAATGADISISWEVSEGQRRLLPDTGTLHELGVVAGAILRMSPSSGPPSPDLG